MTRARRPAGPAISADVVALVPAPDGSVGLLLSRRQFAPNLGDLALPGVLILAGETVIEACHRALASKSGITPDHVGYLRMAWLADSPVRDERGHTISVTYLAVSDDRSAAARAENELFALHDRPHDLPFDHDAIIDAALGHARQQLWERDGELACALLGPRFTTPEAVALIRDLDPAFNTTNTPRLLGSRSCLRRAPTERSTGRGRPPTTWEFVRDSDHPTGG